MQRVLFAIAAMGAALVFGCGEAGDDTEIDPTLDPTYTAQNDPTYTAPTVDEHAQFRIDDQTAPPPDPEPVREVQAERCREEMKQTGQEPPDGSRCQWLLRNQ